MNTLTTYLPIMHETALRKTRCYHAGNDLVQDVCLKLLEKGIRVDNNSHAMSIVTNHFIDDIRRRTNETARLEKFLYTVNSTIQPIGTRRLEAVEDLRMYERRFRQKVVKDIYRHVFVMRYIGYSFKEIAVTLNMPLNTVLPMYLQFKEYMQYKRSIKLHRKKRVAGRSWRKSDLNKIETMFKAQKTRKEIAAIYNVHVSTIENLVIRMGWTRDPKPYILKTQYNEKPI